MPKSRKSRNVYGEEFIQHFDDEGRKVGISRDRRNWLGEEYIENLDSDGKDLSRSRDVRNIYGEDFQEHIDSDYRRVGTSRVRTDFVGLDYFEHRQADGTVIGRSRIRTDWLGERYIEHSGKRISLNGKNDREVSRLSEQLSSEYHNSEEKHLDEGSDSAPLVYNKHTHAVMQYRFSGGWLPIVAIVGGLLLLGLT